MEEAEGGENVIGPEDKHVHDNHLNSMTVLTVSEEE